MSSCANLVCNLGYRKLDPPAVSQTTLTARRKPSAHVETMAEVEYEPLTVTSWGIEPSMGVKLAVEIRSA